MSITRYCAGDGEPRAEHPEGLFVLFSDVEEALKDSKRLAWLLPVIDGDDDDAANVRTLALASGLLSGLTGNVLVDYAMQRCPAND